MLQKRNAKLFSARTSPWLLDIRKASMEISTLSRTEFHKLDYDAPKTCSKLNLARKAEV